VVVAGLLGHVTRALLIVIKALPELSAVQAAYLAEVDHWGHGAIVASDPRTGEGLSVARHVRFPNDPAANGDG